MESVFGDTSSPMFILQGVHQERNRDNNCFILSPTDLALERHETTLVPNPSIGPIHGYNLVGAINGVLCLQ